MRVILSAGKKVYFTLLASSFMFPISAFAQCTETDCNTLGYDSTTSCDNGIKCPFGEYWACPEPEEEKAVLGQCTGYAKNCKIADILYSDGTCSADVISGKTPIAVVVYISDDKNCGQALALEELGNFQWSTEYVDIPDLPNQDNAPKNDFSSCENTKIVLDYSHKQYGDSASKYYPAFWAVYNYTPAGAPETKGKWCLPAAGVLKSVDQNKTNIDQSLTRINKENIGNSFLWTSSEYSNSNPWIFNASSGAFDCHINYKYFDPPVRPVIEF